MTALRRWTYAWVASIGLAGSSHAADPSLLVVKNAGAALGETPVVVTLDRPMGAGIYTLKPPKGGGVIRAEVFEDGDRRFLAVVFPAIPSGEQSFDLDGPIRIKGIPDVRMTPEGDNVEIKVFETPFTTHHADIGPKPILYPLLGPTNVAVTRDYPIKDTPGEDRDHPHQRSFWFTHGKVNGVDFWSEQKGHGSIRQTGIATVRSGFPAGFLRTTDDWLGPDGTKICEDNRRLIVYATKDSRVLDFDVTLKATSGPVTLGDTKEGTFGIRVASSMDVNRKKGGRITNAEGLTDLAAWGKPSPWVDYSGPVGGETLGIAILNHPSSFRYPTEWHVRDYGLFAANPFGWKDYGRKESGAYTIPAGESITFRYRVVIHKGDASRAKPADAFRGYADGVTLDLR